MLLNSVLYATLWVCANASPIVKRDTTEDADFLNNISGLAESNSTNISSNSSGYVRQDLFEGLSFNAIQVSIGSDNQTLLLKLDSNTPNIWVNSDVNEYCLAYVPSFNTTSNSSIFKDVSEKLQDQAASAVLNFQSSANSVIKELSTASIDYKSYASSRKSEFQATVSAARASATKAAASVLSAAGITSIPKFDDTFGSRITSNAALVATEIATDARSFATKVTSVGGEVYTFITRYGEDFASDATSVGGEFATDVTSVGGEFATDVTSVGGRVGKTIASGATSVFGDVTSGAVNGWDSFTSNFFNNFGKQRSISSAVSTTATSKFAEPTHKFITNYTNPEDNTTAISDGLYTFQRDCSLFGVFNDVSSDTFVALNNSVFINNGTDYAFGFLGNDTLTVDGISIEATFAVADSSDSNIGVFGIGKSTANFTSYPQLLVENGEISKAVYQLIMGYYDVSNILFGAIDYSAIDGNITLVPFAENTTDLAFDVSALYLTSENWTDTSNTTYSFGSNLTAIIDTTLKNVLLPAGVIDELINGLNRTVNVTYSEVFGRYVLDDIPDSFLSLEVNGTEFDIPIENFLVPFFSNDTVLYNETYKVNGDYSNSSYYVDMDFEDYEPTFILSILPSADDSVVLGLDFFQDTIVLIVDLEDEQIGLAYLGYFGDYESDDYIVIIEDEIPLYVAFEALDDGSDDASDSFDDDTDDNSDF